MGGRYWLWMGARLLAAVAIVAWAASYLGTGSGEKELQKSLDAMKHVHSFRVASTTDQIGVQHNEMLWEVDCIRDLLHHQTHMVMTGSNSGEVNGDELYVKGREYDRQTDGSWGVSRYGGTSYPAGWYCRNLAQGTDSNLLPPIATMIKRGIIQKGDKKTVNGVRCREWLVTMKGAPNGLEHDTLCLGLEDHLPYEMTVDWGHSHATFSDYNREIQFDLPEEVVRATSTSASN
jgi:hypothetical protein